MKALLDTNVILDFVLERRPFFASAVRVLSLIESGKLSGVVCATTVTTVYYLASKGAGRERAHEFVQDLLKLVEVAPVNRWTLESALKTAGPDFEDNVIAAAGAQVGADCIVTRDQAGFRHADCLCVSPRELLASLQQG